MEPSMRPVFCSPRGKSLAPRADCAPAGPVGSDRCCAMESDEDWMDTDTGVHSRGPAHAAAMERGGLDMAALKEAMTREAAAQEPLVAIIGALLTKTVQRNDALGRAGQLAGFEGDRICALPAADYLDRIMRYGRLYFSNKHWAKIGGLSLQEVNALELSVLRTLDWRMAVTREDYLAYLEELGCGGPAAGADAEAWAADLDRLRQLVTSGAGIRLYSDASQGAADAGLASAPSKPATVYTREMQRADR